MVYGILFYELSMRSKHFHLSASISKFPLVKGFNKESRSMCASIKYYIDREECELIGTTVESAHQWINLFFLAKLRHAELFSFSHILLNWYCVYDRLEVFLPAASFSFLNAPTRSIARQLGQWQSIMPLSVLFHFPKEPGKKKKKEPSEKKIIENK